MSQEIAGRKLDWTYSDEARRGDHIWWIGDNSLFQSHYPQWQLEYEVPRILKEIHEYNRNRWRG
jgi:CDP-paratose 2-epimerase